MTKVPVFAPSMRKFVLATHITVSVGWLGAVAAYLVLDLTAARSDDIGTLRAMYIAMETVARWCIVPFAILTLLTGIVISLGTKWGLVRHYWVIISLILTLIAVAVLMVETGVIYDSAAVARNGSDAAVLALQNTLPHSIGGILVLLTILVLNIYKPRGITPYGWRKQQRESA